MENIIIKKLNDDAEIESFEITITERITEVINNLHYGQFITIYANSKTGIFNEHENMTIKVDKKNAITIQKIPKGEKGTIWLHKNEIIENKKKIVRKQRKLSKKK